MEKMPVMAAATDMTDRAGQPEMAIIGYNRDPDKTREVALEGAIPAFSLAEIVGLLPKPRAVWLMLPAGAAKQAQMDELSGLLEPGDLIIDGGNSRYTDSQRRATALAEHGKHLIDAADSGEGRWTVEEAIRLCVPAPVVSAALFARFASQQEDSPTLKVVTALRNQFGGHAVRSS